MNREQAVAGYFYPEKKDMLTDTIRNFIKSNVKKEDALGVLSPHAGYVYSGAVAGEVYSRVNIPDEVIILCPNHTGMGVPFSLWSGGSWHTPLGDVKVSEKLCKMIKSSYELIEDDEDAHIREHAAEVQLPFLQYLNPNVAIAVVVLAPDMVAKRKEDDLPLKMLQQFGSSLGKRIKDYGKKVLLVASSDMNHYESHDIAKEKDAKAIREIEKLDEAGLYNVINKYGITMCGYAPAIAMLAACKVLGAKNAELVRYSTSGETSGDYNSVVGYAGILIK